MYCIIKQMIKSIINKLRILLLAGLLTISSVLIFNSNTVIADSAKYNFYSSNISTYAGEISSDYNFNSNIAHNHIYKLNYDDSWFKDNYSYNYNHDIAKFMMNASIAAFDPCENDKSKNIRNLFDIIGYSYVDNIVYNESQNSNDTIVYPSMNAVFDYQDISKDTIGYGIAYKNVDFGNDEKYTIIGIAIRGGGYESEWASNFTIGTNGDVLGYKLSTDIVENKFSDILNNINSPYPIKIWMTGYSRGATVANILGHRLNDYANKNNLYGIKPEDIFSYTFEAPMAKDISTNSSSYILNTHTYDVDDNIFNICNPIDLITYVAMKELNFGRYGVDKYLPSSITNTDYYNTNFVDMYNSYKDILEYDSLTARYVSNLNEYTKQESNQKNLIETYAYGLSSLFNNDRNEYVSSDKTNAQAVVRMLIGEIKKGSSLTKLNIKYQYIENSILTLFKDKIKSDSISLDLADTDNINKTDAAFFAMDFISRKKKNKVVDYNFTFYVTSKDGSYTLNEKAYLTAAQFNILYSFLPKDLTNLIDNFSLIEVKEILDFINGDELNTYIDYNKGLGDRVAYSHYPELELAWLESGDETIYKEAQYNKIKVNGNVNIKVYYKDILACDFSRNGIVNTSLECYIDDDNNLVVDVPNSSDYAIYIYPIAKLGSNTSISFNTYNINTKNYSIKNGSYSLNGSTTSDVYCLQLSKDNESLKKNNSNVSLSVNKSSKGDITDAYLNLNVDSNKGSVIGGGRFGLYDLAHVKANVNDYYEFIGWTNEKGIIVSQKAEDDILVKYDEVLTAKIDPIEYKITYHLNNGENNKDNPDSFNIESNTINLGKAIKEDYDFDGWYLEDSFKNKVENINPKEIHKDIDLYAKWTVKKYTVRFMVENKEYAVVNDIEKGNKISDFPTNPSISDKQFNGWFALIGDEIVQINKDTIVTQDIEVHGNFNEIVPAYTISINHGANAGLITYKADGVLLDSVSDGNNILSGKVNEGIQFTNNNIYSQNDGTATIDSLDISCNEELINVKISDLDNNGFVYIVKNNDKYELSNNYEKMEILLKIEMREDKLNISFINITCDISIVINYKENTKIDLLSHGKLNDDGTINLDYSVKLPLDINPQETYVLVNGNKTYLDSLNKNGDNYIVPISSIAPKQMNDNTTIQFFDDNDNPISNPIINSPVKYLRSVIETENNEKIKAFAKSTLNFGAYAQIYFDYDKDNLANKDYAYEDSYLASIKGNSIDQEQEINNTNGLVRRYGISLTLNDVTDINLYLLYKDNAYQDYEVYCDDILIKAKEKGSTKNGQNIYCYTINKGVAAPDLDDKHVFEVKYKGKVIYTYICSPLSYSYGVITNYADNKDEINIVRLSQMLYDYNDKSEEALKD